MTARQLIVSSDSAPTEGLMPSPAVETMPGISAACKTCTDHSIAAVRSAPVQPILSCLSLQDDDRVVELELHTRLSE